MGGLAYNQFLYHVDIVAGDAHKVGALCEVVDIECLDAVAAALHGLGNDVTAVDVGHLNLHLAVGTTDTDGGYVASGIDSMSICSPNLLSAITFLTSSTVSGAHPEFIANKSRYSCMALPCSMK